MSGVLTVDEVREIEFPVFGESDGTLAVYQPPGKVPFAIQRVFCVRAGLGAVRGQHAHRRCSQLLVAVSGRVLVVCNDGTATKTFVLAGLGKGILVPPSIWAEQIYEEEDTVLMVLCDRPYEAEDYIRDLDSFLSFRGLRPPSC
jgi:dTDP-4-dehydrorhamnose 3,5-epimerase-like enzyme